MHSLPVAQGGTAAPLGVTARGGCALGGGNTTAILAGACFGAGLVTAGGSGSSLMERCVPAPRAAGPEPPSAMHPERRKVAPSAGSVARANRTGTRYMMTTRKTPADHPGQAFRIH